VSARPPTALGPVYAFHVLNTLSWGIVHGVPLLLFLKSLHAPATVLGLVLGMTPFMQILQIPGARWVERVGYKHAAVRGWAARNLVLLGLVAVAFLADRMPAVAAIAATAGVMLCYNLLRGTAGAAFMPWLSQLPPPEARGAYLAREKVAIQCSLLVTFVLVAWFLGAHPTEGAFAWVFLYAWLMGAMAVISLRRIPDVPVAPTADNPTTVPWRTLWAHAPFRRQVLAMATMNLAQAAASVLWVPVLRDRYGIGDAGIATMPILSAGVNALCMMVLGRVLDRAGSRPVLAVASVLTVAHLLLWAALAAELVPYGLPVLLAIQVTAGSGFAGVLVAAERLMIANVPGQGRSHFFALASMVYGLILGLGPMAWGAMVDLLGTWTWGPLNHHSLPYLGAAGIAAAGGLLLRRIPEERHLTTTAFLAELVRLPARAMARFRE